MMENLLLLSPSEQALRIEKLRAAMCEAGIKSAIISSNANIYYLTGRVFSGYVYIPEIGEPIYFVKRPVHLLGNTISIRKPEGMLSELSVRKLPLPEMLGLELNSLSYAMAQRLMKTLNVTEPLNVSQPLAIARSTKTDHELKLMIESGVRHELVYKRIPQLFHSGMTDIEFQIEIERTARLEGCLGQFRINGDDMELHMGNVLAGDNADAPSPYDFAMGGAGMDPSLPVGANGSLIRPGMSVMVDMNGNFTGYMTDMSRTFYLGKIDERAIMAHETSIEICHELEKIGLSGTEAKVLYEVALDMAKQRGLEDYFMGHNQHAGFVGHGVGIEVNELPVLAPRSRDILALGNTIAIEPKFVIPGTGAVGIENTYIVTEKGLESITNAPEQLISLD